MNSLEERVKDKNISVNNKYNLNLEIDKSKARPPPIKRQLAFQKKILEINTMNSIVQYLQK